MCGNPPELDFPSSVSELIQCSYRIHKNVLSRRTFGISYRLDGGLVVREDDALGGGVCFRVHIEYNLERQFYASQLCCIHRGGS